MSSPTVKAFSRLYSTVFQAAACTCWTNRRPLFRPRVSLRFWLLWTDWSAKIPSLLIATHSPLLLAYPNAEIFVLSERGIEKTPYRQTEPYLLTKRFLEAPERMLNELLGTEEEAFEAR